MYSLEFDLGNNVGQVKLHFVRTQVTLLLPGSGVNRNIGPIFGQDRYGELVGLGVWLDAAIRFATLAEFAGPR